MTAPIKLYAIEIQPRDFALTGFKLDNGFEYSGILLFDTPEKAQCSINEDIAAAIESRDEEGLDSDDEDYTSDDEIRDDHGSVAQVLIHADGQSFNDVGHSLAGYIGRSEGKTSHDVERHIGEYFKYAVKIAASKERTNDSDCLQP